MVVLPQNSLNANLLLTVPIAMPRQWANSSEAKDNAEVQRASTLDVRRLVALATGRAYLAVYAQKLVIEVDERARDTARKHYDYAHKRYSGGVGTSLDEVRAAQEVAGDEALVQTAYSALSTAQEALGTLVGVDAPLDSAEEPSLATPPRSPMGSRTPSTGPTSSRSPRSAAPPSGSPATTTPTTSPTSSASPSRSTRRRRPPRSPGPGTSSSWS